jgi:large subunit ribosomal protein L19e
MKLKIQRRLAAGLLKCSENRIVFDNTRLEDIKEAITKADIKSLIANKIISKKPLVGVSRVRARERKKQKRKGKRRGLGSRKGKKTARLPKKKAWIIKIRVQRGFIRLLRDKGVITIKGYHELYSKAKGGFFRSKRHIKMYMEERGLAKNK